MMIGLGGNGGGYVRNIQRTTDSVSVRRRRRRRRAVSSDAHNPFRAVRLRARGRIFRPDGGGAPSWFGRLAPVFAVLAMIAGYTLGS